MIVRERLKMAAKATFIEHDEVIKALATNRAD